MGKERYELLERIGVGSFATVYRARDTELGREVAIKQIAENFMHNPEQMERYWQEAQLLASLQHPNVVTFFDIDRKRGWLIMELMQGTLGSRVTRDPMDLRSVRTALAHALRALKYLHSQGIVHGDIKPGNLMIDARKRIKIGDFGLARRVSDDDGSLLKGTTKYMAPEMLSEEFGEVGPASDLYSIGFSAYELMCGPNFESLFPGLGAFGRDRQIAWMMWHSAADRTIPEITRVLEGVPEDLAKVVQKLVAKKQSERYQTAEEALSDLNIDLKIVKTGTDAPEEVEVTDRKRIAIAGGAFAFSLILSLVMLFSGGDDPKPKEQQAAKPISGVVGHVLADRGLFTVTGEDGIPQQIEFGDRPKILLNKTTYITAMDLLPEDRVVITPKTNEDGHDYLDIAVLRPGENKGYISSIQPQLGQLVMEITEGAQRGELLIRDTGSAKITMNGKPAKFAALKKDDLITIRHMPGADVGSPRLATEIVALQLRQLEGFLREVTPERLTVQTHLQGTSDLVKLDVAQECGVTVNGKQIVDGRLLKPVDLQPGDRVKVKHHQQIVQVDALRQFLHTGVLLDVRTASSSLIVNDSENGSQKAFLTSEKTEVTINGQPGKLPDLRRNDRLEITYDQTKQQNDASAVDALRPVIENRFAIVIGNQDYDDNNLTKLPFATADARLIQETLIGRYGVSPARVLLLIDETRVRIEQAVPDWLRKTTETSELLVMFVGHAYTDEKGVPYLAAKDFALNRTAESGVALSWLRQQLEDCPAREKLLLLDICHAGEGADLMKQPAVSAMLAAVKPERDPAVFRSTFAIAASGPADRSLLLGEEQHGAFAWFVAEGLAGRGDKNQDVHLEPTELFDFLKTAMASVEVDKKRQQPEQFLPDATPPPDDRLSPEAKDSIRKLLATHWNATRLSASGDFVAASRLAGDEPDARIAYAVLLIKTRNAKDSQEAQSYLDEVRLTHPKNLITYEAQAWIHAYGNRYSKSVEELTAMFSCLHADNPEGIALNDEVRRILDYAGRIREYSVTVAEDSRRLMSDDVAPLDASAGKLGPNCARIYETARMAVRDQIKKYDEEIAAEGDSADGQLLALARKRLASYVQFDFDEVRKQIVRHLDDQ